MGRKFTIFALFIDFVFEGKLEVQAPPPRDLYSQGTFNGGFLRYDFGGTWRGLFSEFYGIVLAKMKVHEHRTKQTYDRYTF